MTERVSVIWNDFWFEPRSSKTLGVIRFLFFTILFCIFVTIPFQVFGEIPLDLANLMPLQKVFGFPFFSFDTLVWVSFLWKFSLFCSAIGMWTRFSCFVAFVLGFYLISLTFMFTQPSHAMAIPLVLMAAFSIAPSGRSFSVDSYFKKSKVDISGVYGWPIKLCWFLWALMFFAAGLSKLRHSGLDWITHPALQEFAQLYNLFFKPLLGPIFSELPYICFVVLSIGVILAELMAPLVLFKKTRVPIYLVLLSMQVGIYLTIAISFHPQLALIPFFVPWEKVWSKVSSGTSNVDIN